MFQPGAFLGFLYLGRHRDVVIEGREHEISSGERDFACQPRPLGVNGLFDNLHQHFLTLFQGVLYAAFLGQFGLDGCFVKRVQVALVAEHLLQILGVRIELYA